MRDLREKDWFWLDNALIDRTDLNLYEKMLYVCLARHIGKKEYAYPALETLAKELGIKDTRTIVKYTKSLADKGLVVIEKLKGKSNRYYLKNVEKTENASKITPVMLRGFIIELQKNEVGKRSINRKLSSLRSFFKYLIKNNLIKNNPIEIINSPSFEAEKPDILTLEEINRLRPNTLWQRQP